MDMYLISNGYRSGYDLYKLPTVEDIKADNYFGSWTCNREDATYFKTPQDVYKQCLRINGNVRRDDIVVVTQDENKMLPIVKDVQSFNGMQIICEYNRTSNGFLAFDFKEKYSKHVRPIDIFETFEIMGYLSRKGTLKSYTLAAFKKAYLLT